MRYGCVRAALRGWSIWALAGWTWGLGGADVPFTGLVIDTANPANPHCKAVGDIDGDGFLDILAASSSGDGLFWYRYPSWMKHRIAPGSFSTDMQAGDVDGDGFLDVIIPQGSDGGTIVWYENPAATSDPAGGGWSARTIGTHRGHDVEVGDIDGNGRLDVLVRGAGTTVVFLQTNALAWARNQINSSGTEGSALGDIDRDGDLDVAQDGYWLEAPTNPATGAWPRHTVAEEWVNRVAVDLADLNRDGRLDMILAPSESSGRLVWYEGPANPRTDPWTEHVIDDTVSYLHTFKTADVDKDGDNDLVAAEMHQSSDPDEVSIYFNEGDGLAWRQQIVATTGSHNLRVRDIEFDGDIDIVGANWNDAAPDSAVVRWWRNDLNNARSLDQWERRVIDAERPWRAVFVLTGDLDRDGLPDVATGGWWYRNPGRPEGAWTRRVTGSPFNNLAAVHDFDGDGDLDLLGTRGQGSDANAEFIWAQNDGAGGFMICSNVPAGNGDFLQGVAVARFSPGGPREVALSWHAGGRGVQMLTVPADPVSQSWSWRQIAAVSQDEQLSAGDIDRSGDGRLDLLLGTKWMRNNGTTWTDFTLNTAGGAPDRNRLADINRDGRLDAVVGFEAVSTTGRLCWYEQPADPAGSWPEHVIASIIGPMSVDVADMDADGDLDVVAGEHHLDQPASARLFVFENADGAGEQWLPHLVYTGDEHHDGARLVDIDLDGDLDIVSIGWSHSRVLLFENRALLGTGPANRLPTVKLVSPGSGLVINPGVDVLLEAEASDSDGKIARVDFVRDTNLVASVAAAPWLWRWANAAAGSYTLSAKAVDDKGATSSSTTVFVQVMSAGTFPTNGLAVWFRADAGITQASGRVSRWEDQSGSGRHAVQATSASQPLWVADAVPGGKPVVRFDGVNDFMTFTLPVNGLTGMSLFLVANNSADRTGGSSQAGEAALFWNETVSWGTVYLSPYQSQVNFRFGTTQLNNRATYTRPVSIGAQYSLSTSIKDGATDTLYVNGQRVIRGEGKLAAIAGCTDTGNLGRGYNDNTYFPGDIAEALVYTRALSENERVVVEQALAAKYFSTEAARPELEATGNETEITILWPAMAWGFVLETSADLGPLGWQTESVAPTVVGDRYQASLMPASGSRFYRLRK